MAFLHQFASSAIRHWPVTVIDPDPHSAFSKTWCYWSKPDELQQLQPDFSWTAFQVSGHKAKTTCRLQHYNYHCVAGASFHKLVMKQIESLPNIRFVQEKAEQIVWNPQQNLVEVTLANSQKITAAYCFTSAPGRLRSGNQSDQKPKPFLQQFAGGVVEFDEPVFDTNTLSLMDFEVQQHPGSVHFAYILPHNERRALIEITAFTPALYSDEHFQRAFNQYLDRIGTPGRKTYRLIEPEQGVIPMHIDNYERRLNAHTFTLGTRSGMVKPSTGYAFFAMHEQARYYISALEKGGQIQIYPTVPGRFRFYDALLLNILRCDPHQTIPIFQTLFQKVSADRVLKFLRESSSLPDEVQIFSRLPKKPFLKALWRHVFS